DSMLNFYRQMIAFRKAYPALLKGTFETVEATDDYLSFERVHGNVRLFCAFNLSDDPKAITLPDGVWDVESGAPFTLQLENDQKTLPPWQALFATAQG
ncbi:MAG: DUF3459 domain-containing protein, partial [Pseudomonadota bacterium]